MQGVFQDYEVASDPEDWNRIEKTLRGRKKRRILPWIIWASAACLLTLLAIYTGGLLNHSEKSNTLTAVNEYKSVNSFTKTGIIKQGKHRTEKLADKLIQQTKATETKSILLSVNQSKQIPPLTSKDKMMVAEANHPVVILSRNENSNLLIHVLNLRKSESIVLSSSLRNISKDFSYGWLKNTLDGKNPPILMASTASTLKFKGFSLSNSSGFIPPASSKEMMSYPGVFASQLASNMYLSSVKVFDNSYLASLNIGNLFQNNSRDYLPPITFGLNVNLSFAKDWSIETGLQYSRLQSNGTISIRSSSAIQITTSFGYTVNENLDYIGIPVIVNYNLSKNRKTSFYLSAGLSIEKGIIAKYKASPEDNFPGMTPIYSQNAIPGLQFSLNSGIGITYKFIPHFELFGQPSIGYYFKNGKTTTIYSAHPELFNLRTGIRYTIK